MESSKLHEIKKTVNKELIKLNVWLNVNRLSLNISKTNFVIFAPVNKPMKCITILINRQAIAQKDYVKYLGVLIDFSTTYLINKKKVSRTIGIMYKLRHFVNKKVLISIYYSLVYPFLIYAIPVWGVANDSHINPIKILQKKIVRMITFADKFPRPIGPLAHTPPIFHELEILTITDVFKVQTAKFVYNCVNVLSPVQFRSFFTFTNSNYNTAASRNESLYIPHARTTNYGLNSIKNIGARIWNHIPINIRSNVSVKSFTKNLKQHFLSSYKD